MNDPGVISSRREPTAENARMARTPRDLSADMLAREGTEEGLSAWLGPWRATKATRVREGEGRDAIVIGEDGKPHG
jgi:hypothetical protein